MIFLNVSIMFESSKATEARNRVGSWELTGARTYFVAPICSFKCPKMAIYIIQDMTRNCNQVTCVIFDGLHVFIKWPKIYPYFRT